MTRCEFGMCEVICPQCARIVGSARSYDAAQAAYEDHLDFAHPVPDHAESLTSDVKDDTAIN